MHKLVIVASILVLLLSLAGLNASGHHLLSSDDVGVKKCEFQGQLGDDPANHVRLYVFLTACTRPLEQAAQVALGDGNVPHGAAAPPPPNFFLSGFAFLLQLNRSVTTTQLQQPLSTLLWAAQRPRAELLFDGSAGGNSDASSSSTSGGMSGSTVRQEGAAPQTLSDAVAKAALQLANGTDQVITIRSLRSSKQYGMHLSYRDASHWPANPSLRREPGRLSARISLDLGELRILAGVGLTESNVPSPGETASTRAPAFEIQAAGFAGACTYTPTRSRRMPPPKHASRGPSPGPATDALSPGAPTCAWLDPDRIVYDRALYDFWRRLQRDTTTPLTHEKKRRRRRRRLRPPPPPPPPPPVTSLSAPSYMVMSPYFNLTSYDFMTLLSYHMDYHAAMGVQRYLVYVEEGEEGLAADERLAVLAAAGRVDVVRWRELPAFKQSGSDVRHPYASQILIYNHALLSLFHEAAVVAVADLDEYLLTSHTMKLEQVVMTCAPRGRYAPAALWVPRRSAQCTSCWASLVATDPETRALVDIPEGARGPPAKALQELAAKHLGNKTLVAAAATLERKMWLADGGGAATAAVPGHHPLEGYRHWGEGWHHKSLMYSHLVSYFGVHLAYSEAASKRPHTISRLGCAVWAHLETQLGPREQRPLMAAAEGLAGRGGEGGGVNGTGGSYNSTEAAYNRTEGGYNGTEEGYNGTEGEYNGTERGYNGMEEGYGNGKVRSRGGLVPVENRYWGTLERCIGRPVPRTWYWGQQKG